MVSWIALLTLRAPCGNPLGIVQQKLLLISAMTPQFMAIVIRLTRATVTDVFNQDYVHTELFFFQAEDGIRDRNVTGAQTCALPIWAASRHSSRWTTWRATSGPSPPWGRP